MRLNDLDYCLLAEATKKMSEVADLLQKCGNNLDVHRRYADTLHGAMTSAFVMEKSRRHSEGVSL